MDFDANANVMGYPILICMIFCRNDILWIYQYEVYGTGIWYNELRINWTCCHITLLYKIYILNDVLYKVLFRAFRLALGFMFGALD